MSANDQQCDLHDDLHEGVPHRAVAPMWHLLTRLRIAGGVVLFALLCLLWIVNCSGPRPAWSHLQVQPPSASSQNYQVSLQVTNTGPGHGQVDVIVRLKSKQTGQTYQQDQTVTLESGETTKR